MLELEREADPDGEWMSYGVRMKLDLVGRKISLDDWQSLTSSARTELNDLAVETDQEIEIFANRLLALLTDAGLQSQALGEEKLAGVSDWRDPGRPGGQADVLLRRLGAPEIWSSLDRFARYVVCTFARKQDLSRARRALIQLGYLES